MAFPIACNRSRRFQRLTTAFLALLLGFGLADRRAESADIWWPGDDFPAADRATAPRWLTSEKICFSRWDGGRIEACKGFLSGWTYFNNPPWPDVIHATSRWYDPQTVHLAERMGYNFLWVTFSAGFSIELEQGQWEELRVYVAACHKKNIKVAAYMSSTNMFVDDMLAHVPESRDWLLIGKNGKPVPYGAANFKRMGRTTRMLADMTHPGWRAYLKKRIDAAIDIGVDAIEYDNVSYVIGGSERSKRRYTRFLEKNRFADSAATREAYRHETERRLFRELLAHARLRKPDMVLFHNANYGGYAVSRSDTVISTEDGKEPGYYAIDAYGHETRGTDLTEPVYHDPLDADLGKPFDPAKLVTNLHLLRMLKSLDQGWKPVLVEFGGRRNGHRMLNQMPPLAFQLSVAECNAALCSYQGYQEGRALTDLFERKPEVMPIVDAARQVHRFVRRHQQVVVGARPMADVAVVLDDRMKGRDLLRTLARKNVQFEVLLDNRVRPETLKQFQRVLVYQATLISDRAVDGLKQFAGEGGRLMVCKPSGERDLWGQSRADNPLVAGGPWEFRGNDCPQEELVRFLTKDVTAPLEIVDCPYVLFTLTRHPDQPDVRFVAHLLNYVKRPLENVTLRCPDAKEVKLLSFTPDCGKIERGPQPGEWIIPRLGLYSLMLVR